MALLQPWIGKLLKHFFRRGSVDIFETGTVEVGYSTFGPTIGLHGTLRARDADAFVRAVRLDVEREKDKAEHSFEWVAFRAHRLFIGRPDEMALELPAGFLLPTSQPRRYNTLFHDPTVAAEVANDGQQLAQAYFDASLQQQGFDDFAKLKPATDAFAAMTRRCYWEAGTYKLTLAVLTSRPDARFERRYRFALTEADAHALQLNVVSMIRESCGQEGAHYNFAYSKYLAENSERKGGAL